MSDSPTDILAKDDLPALDIERQSIRGRACPVCGGKIIPSNRAIYQSTGDPSEVFPLWQCERCGYEEMSEKPAPPAKPAPAHKKPKDE